MDKHTGVVVRISSCQSPKGTRLKSGSGHLALSLDLDPKDAACGVCVQTKLHHTGHGEDIALLILASMGVVRINHRHDNCICPCPSSQSNVHNLCSSKVRCPYNRKRVRTSHCQPHAPSFTHLLPQSTAQISVLPAELLDLIVYNILAFDVSPRMKVAAMARGLRKVWAMHVSVFDCALGRFNVRSRIEKESQRCTHLALPARRGCW